MDGAVKAKQDGTISQSGSVLVQAISTDTATANTFVRSAPGSSSAAVAAVEYAEIGAPTRRTTTPPPAPRPPRPRPPTTTSGGVTIKYTATSANTAKTTSSIADRHRWRGLDRRDAADLEGSEADTKAEDDVCLDPERERADGHRDRGQHRDRDGDADLDRRSSAARSGADAEIGKSASVTAKVGAGSDKIPGGAVSVTANANSATASGHGLSVGILAVGLTFLTAYDDGAATANFDGRCCPARARPLADGRRKRAEHGQRHRRHREHLRGRPGRRRARTATIDKDANVSALVGSDASIWVTGAVSLDGELTGTKNTASASAKGISGGVLVGAAVMSTDAEIGAGIDSEVDGAIHAAGSLSVTANGANTATATTQVAGLSLLAGLSGGGALAKITSDSVFKAGSGVGSTGAGSSGGVTVKATGVNTATATADAGSAGLVAIGVALPQAEIGGAVSADWEGGIAAANSFTITATGTNTATATATPVSVGVFSGSGSASSALIDQSATVIAKAGHATDNVSGAVSLTATETNTATATGNGLSVSGVASIAATFPTASVDGGATANFDGTLPQGTAEASSLSVDANATNTATATANLVGASLGVGVAGANAQATVGKHAKATTEIGSDGSVAVSGTVSLDGELTGSGNTVNASAQGVGGGILAGAAVHADRRRDRRRRRLRGGTARSRPRIR